MKFAIVDIETTGGNAQSSGITEIGIVLVDDNLITGEFETLVNPEQPIPFHITMLTGITNHMVEDAPKFDEIAGDLYELLKDRVFVAHNVHFDYSFILHQFQESGINWSAKKMCTVRYARKVWPGMRSYGLGKLCLSRGVVNDARHRALGDARATSQLFLQMLTADAQRQYLHEMLKTGSGAAILPMNVPAELWVALPELPGVYYFRDQVGKVLYVGKAVNIRRRVRGHFSNTKKSRKLQEWARRIFSIDFEICVSELHSLALEELEIKRLWPEFNLGQKRPNPAYALYDFFDQRGFRRLVVTKLSKYSRPLALFHRPEDCFRWGRKLADEFEVDEQLLFATGRYNGESTEALVQEHNEKIAKGIEALQTRLPNFVYFEKSRHPGQTEKTVCYLIENGCFAGMRVIEDYSDMLPDDIPGLIKREKDNEYIRMLILRQAMLHPERVFNLQKQYN